GGKCDFPEQLGLKGRLAAMQGAILRVKLPHLEAWNSERRPRAANYDRLFKQSGLASPQGSCPIRLLHTLPRANHVFLPYVIRATRRDELRGLLTERKISTEI